MRRAEQEAKQRSEDLHGERVAEELKLLLAPEVRVEGEGLREAIKHGSLGGVRTVVDEAAANGVENVGCYIDYSGQPMLHLACIFNNVEIVMFLIERGADPDTKNARDETAYDIATDTLAAKMKVLVDRLDAGGP